jgi:hypothetical protein
MRPLAAVSLVLILTACPSEEADNVTGGTAPPDANGDTGTPADPDSAPKPEPVPATPDPAAESCVDALARVEAELAACKAK